MAVREYFHEIVKNAESLKTIKERVKYLKKYRDRRAFKGLIQISYDKRIKVSLPDTDPPYKESNLAEGLTDTRIDNEFRRFWVFLEHGPYKDMKQTKREQMFINILENLHAEEAKIFLKAFQHKWRIKGIRTEHVNEIFGLKIPTESKKKS